jgi:hypothetical protein
MDPDADDRQGLLRFPHMVPLENWRNTVAQDDQYRISIRAMGASTRGC